MLSVQSKSKHRSSHLCQISHLMRVSPGCAQITPPWKPDIQNETDTKYIADEFANEPVHLTPPQRGSSSAIAPPGLIGGAAGQGAVGGMQAPGLSSIAEIGAELPHFEAFSYHGSHGGGVGSLSSHLSAMSTSSTDVFG